MNFLTKVIASIGSMIFAIGMISSAETLKAKAYSTSKSNPAIVELTKDTNTHVYNSSKKIYEYQPNNSDTKILRKGYYTGYQIDSTHWRLDCGYGSRVIPMYLDSSHTQLRVKVQRTGSYNSKTKTWDNRVNRLGTISQLGENARYECACGPTSVLMLLTHELGDDTYNRVQFINKYKQQVIKNYSSQIYGYASGWGVTSGGSFNINTFLLNQELKRTGLSAKYETFRARLSSSSQLDTYLNNGHRLVAGILHQTVTENGLAKNYYDYAHRKFGHYVVIVAEEGGSNGYYYIADPYYYERSPYQINRGMYYYGLEKVKKTDVIASMKPMGDNGILTVRYK